MIHRSSLGHPNTFTSIRLLSTYVTSAASKPPRDLTHDLSPVFGNSPRGREGRGTG